jgi:hypothetical protein
MTRGGANRDMCMRRRRRRRGAIRDMALGQRTKKACGRILPYGRLQPCS